MVNPAMPICKLMHRARNRCLALACLGMVLLAQHDLTTSVGGYLRGPLRPACRALRPIQTPPLRRPAVGSSTVCNKLNRERHPTPNPPSSTLAPQPLSVNPQPSILIPQSFAPWPRHTIDDTSRGADGVRLADANGNGRSDIATGWEEGGLVRVYLHPGPPQARRPWPSVTVGRVATPEDAVLADLDNDGALDVVSCCEGSNRTVYFHWAPRAPERYLDPDAWQTAPLAATQHAQQWMFALPMDIDGRSGIDLVVGAKGPGATVGWLESPPQPRNTDDWKLHALYQAGWIMSLEAHDVDRDGDDDLVVSDRRGPRRGVLWLENPGRQAAASGAAWNEHRVGADTVEVLFLTLADLDRDGWTDILTTTRNGKLIFFRREPGREVGWQPYEIQNPLGIPSGKAVRVADVNLDGALDIVHTANTLGNRAIPGVVWMSYRQSVTDTTWDVHDISGDRGIKFDLVQTIDVDGDGDLDVITCEERDNLGLFWYENPTRRIE